MTSPIHDHLTDEELVAAIEGNDSARVIEHLAACPACRTLHHRVSAVLGALRFEPEPSLSDALRDRLLARHSRAHRSRPAVLRFMAYRIPLYQIAAAAAAILLVWHVSSRPPSEARVGTLPPFVAAASDLWAGTAEIEPRSSRTGSPSQPDESLYRSSRPPLDLIPEIEAPPRQSFSVEPEVQSEAARPSP